MMVRTFPLTYCPSPRRTESHDRSTTTFHPDACAVMHELLVKLENWKRSGTHRFLP
jgi:hypothetical protein